MDRERLASRLGFLLMTAGCAIGLGNVWRFPFIVGQYGGAIFVLIYLLFLALIGFPVMVAELAVGRGGQSDLPGAFATLGNGRTNKVWRRCGHVAFCGNVVLLMFYSVVTGWLLAYCWKYVSGLQLPGAPGSEDFGQFLGNWKEQMLFMGIAVAVTAAVCILGVRKGIETAMKVMLCGLFLLEVVLIVLVLQYTGSWAGVKFFLAPDFSKLTAATLWPAIHAAMMQAFFTLSLGVGSVAICGSYIGKERSLAGESVVIIALDTLAAVLAGLIIFPACSAFQVEPNQGPALIFITLTKVFQSSHFGRVLGMLFFLFMSVAALSTLIAVAENIIAYLMRMLGIGRVKSTLIFLVGMFLLSLPCIFGFNLLSGFEPLGQGTCVLDLEDFLVSDNLLPLGAVVILLFCTHRSGWGMDGFLQETNTGTGMHFPRFIAIYMKWLLPLGIFLLWAHNLITRFDLLSRF